ncbi:MAG TPA: carboxypeptidase regulatory-like domain-containing protein [Candidatus Deferrimicrobiaceae bacterium]|nr:carboxypeptidase regulatory-like domain-containing protein [Candidatus Deferrimicrobiaceae bacterium]
MSLVRALIRSTPRSCVAPVSLLCVALCSVTLFGQTTISTGSIQGSITDPSGAVVSDAKISIVNKATGRAIITKSTSAGAYASGALTPGDYKLRVEAHGFKTSESAVTVQVGVTASGNVKLQLGEASQVVQVQATAVAVNTQQATVQGVLTSQQIENLPINGRNFLDLAQLEPGVQIQDGGNFDPTKNGFSSISFGGRFGRTARIEVDGLDISDETVGTTTQNIPASGIQEFQIQQSSLDLSTELTSSGSVNVTTKPGTNKYHGEGYYYFRDQTFDANLPGGSDNYFQRNQYGGNFGGPILRDKLFFFLDVERTQQALINPVLPGGPFSALVGCYNSPFREVEGLGRLDWQINSNYKFFYRFSYDQDRDVSAILPNSFQPFANVNHTPVHALGLDFNTGPYTHSIRFGYFKFRNAIVDATAGTNIFNPVPGIELAIGSDPDCLTAGADFFCSGPSFLAPQQTYQSDHQIKYDGSRALGAHVLRYGAGFNHIFGGGFASFLSLAPAVGAGISDCNAACLALPRGAANPLNYPANNVALGNGQGFDSEIPAFGFPAGGSGPDNRISFYFGDSWKIKPNFTLTYGLRYVRDTGRTDSDLGPISPLYQFDNQFYAGLGNRVHQPNLNFAPQIGLAWDPAGKGKTVIRAGVGLFYENSIWNNIEFDRPARLPTGLFLANPTVCSNGSPATLSLPNGGSVTPTFCGQPIGSVASQISALQSQYQASTAAAGPASNPSFIGNALADGVDVTGTDLLAPNYVSPRSVQMNIGLQHEIRPGMVLTIDYLRNTETHTLLAIDTNHVGDARFFNLANAMAAISATNVQLGCGAASDPTSINCAISKGATISSYASNGLDSGYSFCGGGPCPTAAFPGINQNLGANQMLFPIGYAKNNALQVSMKQHLEHPFNAVTNFDLQASYQLERYIAPVADNDFVNIATDFNNPQSFIGPNGLDREHQISFGGTMDLPYHFRLGMIGHFYSPLPANLTLNPTGNAGGIFVTDVTGDGTGDGSFASNGGTGDVLPGTNIGSFEHGVSRNNINTFINNYNHNFAGQPTPAGQTLINSGLFTSLQLTSLGAVQPVVPAAPYDQVGMGWLRAFDVSLNWIYKFKENFEVQPGVSFFNVMNLSNFDGPGNPLSGVLSGEVGSLNGTSGGQPSSNRLGLGSGVFALGSPRVIEFSLKLSF